MSYDSGRQAGADDESPREDEVSGEMITAGVAALVAELGGEDVGVPTDSYSEAAVAVYLAMCAARLKFA